MYLRKCSLYNLNQTNIQGQRRQSWYANQTHFCFSSLWHVDWNKSSVAKHIMEKQKKRWYCLGPKLSLDQWEILRVDAMPLSRMHKIKVLCVYVYYTTANNMYKNIYNIHIICLDIDIYIYTGWLIKKQQKWVSSQLWRLKVESQGAVEQVSSDTDDGFHAMSKNDHLSSHTLGLVLHMKAAATLDCTHSDVCIRPSWWLRFLHTILCHQIDNNMGLGIKQR